MLTFACFARQDSWPNLQGGFDGPETMSNNVGTEGACFAAVYCAAARVRSRVRSLRTAVAQAEASLTPQQQAQLAAMTASMLAQDNSQLSQNQMHSRENIAAAGN